MLPFFSVSRATKEALAQGMAKTKQFFWTQFNKTLVGKSQVGPAVLEELEELLIGADVGITTASKIIERLEKRIVHNKYLTVLALNKLLKEEIVGVLAGVASPVMLDSLSKPYVILVVGVNGVGKTTTIGKLAAQYRKADQQVVLGAADTFRAAATDQLQQWGRRVGANVVAPSGHTDPAAVVHKTTQEGLRKKADVIIIDTAGRLHTKAHLMNELSKIKRTVQKIIPESPQEVLLVLDGSTGQNAFVQAEAFTKATEVTALAITKLDGTAKGGIVIGIADQFKVPVKYIGVGEGMGDLQLFDRHSFVEALFSGDIIGK